MSSIPPDTPGFIIAMGASCFVSYADESTVLKGYEIWVDGKRKSYYSRDCEAALAREDAVYTHLGRHPRLLECFGLKEISPGIHSLRLERCTLGNVRQYIRDHGDSPLPLRTRLQMCLDIATGLAYIHAKNVWHSDLSCRNFLVFPGFRVKICDFGASLIKGRPEFRASICEESHSELPRRGRLFDDRPRLKRELFALGSAIYELVAWKKPFGELTDEEVEARYDQEEFPDLAGIDPVHIIHDCWHEKYESADEVVKMLNVWIDEAKDTNSHAM